MTRRTRPIVIGAAAVAAVALVAGAVVLLKPAPEFVPQYETIESAPPKVPAGEPAVEAPTDADLDTVVDVTDELTTGFSGDLGLVRTDAQKGEPAFPYTETDACLLDWAKENLAMLAADGTYEVITVCDRPTAVLAGPAGADSKVLVFGALEEKAPTGMKEILIDSPHDRMAFAAVRSADGKAQLLATSELPDPK